MDCGGLVYPCSSEVRFSQGATNFATDRGKSFIIDISADQFGMPPCNVLRVSNEPAVYVHGVNTGIAEHLAILVEMGVIPQL